MVAGRGQPSELSVCFLKSPHIYRVVYHVCVAYGTRSTDYMQCDEEGGEK